MPLIFKKKKSDYIGFKWFRGVYLSLLKKKKCEGYVEKVYFSKFIKVHFPCDL